VGFTLYQPYQDGNVYDTDFQDPDITGANTFSDDTYNFDYAGLAISFYHGHGNTLVAGPNPSQTCTSETNCSTPPAGTTVGWSGYGTCVITPPYVATYGAGTGICFYSTTPALTVCGAYDNTGHSASLSPDMALGENSTVGAWANAGVNGGTALAIVHMSWGLVPFFPGSEWANLFAGLQIYAGMMVTAGDTNDSPYYGELIAASYAANPSSSVASDYVEIMPFISDGSGCTGGYSFNGGINGCGCHVALTMSSSAANATAILNESWSALTSHSSAQTSADYGNYTAECNYDTSTYPMSGGD
jgi:hypothetical protein